MSYKWMVRHYYKKSSQNSVHHFTNREAAIAEAKRIHSEDRHDSQLSLIEGTDGSRGLRTWGRKNIVWERKP